MRSLGPLPLETLPYFHAITAAKQLPRRNRLEQLSPRVEACYNLYAGSTLNLTQLPVENFNEHERQDLVHCYESRTGSLSRLKSDIREHHNDTCPDVAALCQYCGLSYDPSTYDHYLPRQRFPEFSVLSLNLVPCCGRCNELKGTEWLDENGVRKIVSFYYDTLPSVRFLEAEVVVNDGPRVIPVANFNLSNDVGRYAGLMETIHNHYKELELLSRYRRAASARFSDVQIECGSLVQALGRDAVAKMLLAKAQNLSQSRSPNYWEVALLTAMANTPEYLDSLP